MAARLGQHPAHRRAGGVEPILARLALLLWLMLGALPALAQTPEASSGRARLDAIRHELVQIETTVAATGATDVELQRQRLRLQPVLDQLRQLADEQAPRVEQAKLRLEQLGAKPEAGAPPESAEVAREREARLKAFSEADETTKITRASLLQAEQLQTAIGDKRRDLFARALFAAGPTILSPELWGNALTTLPEDLRASGYIFGGWLSVVGDALSGLRGVFVAIAFIGAVLLYVARARYMPRFKARMGATEGAGSLRCLYVAFAHLVAGAAPPALASWLIYSALNTAGLLPPRIQPVIWAAVIGLAIFAFIQALADALFAPGNPQRRLVSVMDSTARIVVWIASSLALVMSVGKVMEAWLQAIAAGLAVSILVRGILAIVFALTLIAGLYQLRDDEEVEEEACLGPYVPVDGASLGPVRILGWIVGVAIVLAALAGYVVFATFLTEQVLWIGILACLFVLFHQLVDLGLSRALTGKGRLALTLKAGIGLRVATLDKIAVIGTGLLKLVLIVIAFLLALAPWGLESADFATSLRAAFFGFQVGGVTVSLSSIFIAGILFALGLTATRTLQGWLEGKFLPTTQLDTGLRNSITTAAGYVGHIAAVALAISSLGLSLERLTLVASALSVGIGFGLQSVVSNFVSGLILLWERPIRVGDQVVVGDAEGIVKKINVRSTEIATFDRSSVIVPNSNLVSGVVRNRVRNDRTGRVLISITVPRTLDPGDVRGMLTDAAAAHGDVLQKPPPIIMFKKLGPATMEFDLICIVAEVDIVGRVTSDLNYVIHKRLTEMEVPPPGAELTVRGLEGIEQSLAGIAEAVSREVAARKAQPKTPVIVRRGKAPADDEPEAAAEPPAKPEATPDPVESKLTGKDDNKE
jgi:small-conductance mechanosensitive channel